MISFVKRVINRLEFERLKLRLKTPENLKKRLKNSFPEINAVSRFDDQYKFYVSAISRADMAASLELSNLIYSLCVGRKSKKMLDMGSGFSSYVLRTYAGESEGCRVWSIDDDAAWLEKTRNYLSDLKVNTENLLTLDNFIQSGEKDFDFILLDLNYVEVRKNYIKLVVERCASDGIIVFDDVHKREFMTEVLRQTNKESIALYNLSDLTKDAFGRFAMLGIKN